MKDLVRFGVSMPVELLEEFDRYISQRNYKNRSEAIRDLIRDKLVEKEWFEIGEEKEVVGAITFVYDHHKRELVNALLDVQHKHDSTVLASQHIHLDHDHCLEVTIVKPADYAVAQDGTIEIQIGETLGHYGDWLRRPSDRIRKLNGLRENAPLIVGRRLKLDFSTVNADAFEGRRIGYHEARQLRYFRRHRIKGVIEHPIISGDNLWLLAVEQYGIPLWLLRQYNPDVTVDTILSLGSIMFVPLVEASSGDSTCEVVQLGSNPAGDDTRPRLRQERHSPTASTGE